MIRAGLLFLLIVASATSKKYPKPAKIVSGGDVADKEVRVRELLTGLATDDVYNHVHQTFPYTDASLYMDDEVLRNFTTYWNQGFLVKYGVFTLNCRRTIRDTDSLYRLLNATKDFDTFYQVAKWAKGEVHPEMYIHAMVSALVERPDTVNVTIPRLYEVLPNYFVPSTVVHGVRTAFMNGVDSRRYQINNTGWEWSWHSRGGGVDMVSPHVIHQYNKRLYDVESRLSYFREDVSRLDFIYKNFILYGLAAPHAMLNEPGMERLGEIRYTILRWILNRYNLERYAVRLPPARPINFDEPIMTGYDPQIVGTYGRPIPGRADNVVPRYMNPEGVAAVEKIASRFYESVEARILRNSTGRAGFRMLMEGVEAVNEIGNMIIGGDDMYYPSLYFNLISLMDGMAMSTNRMGYSSGALLNAYTLARDPVYYQILAYVNNFFGILHSQHRPYTRQELGFPGVTVEDIEFTRLETYYDNHMFNISNLLPGDGGRNYAASQFRIKHKPFSMTIKINSERDTNGVVKVFLGPATDVKNTSLNLNKFRESLILYHSFPAKLHAGENLFKRTPSPDTPDDQPVQDGVSYIQRWCDYPNNLLLPKGTESGTPYMFYVVVYPYDGSADDTMSDDTRRTCIKEHLINDYDHTILFPVDRHWVPSAVNQSNHKVVETLIYHTDIDRSAYHRQY